MSGRVSLPMFYGVASFEPRNRRKVRSAADLASRTALSCVGSSHDLASMLPLLRYPILWHASLNRCEVGSGPADPHLTDTPRGASFELSSQLAANLMATIQDELQLTSTDATEVNLPIAGTGGRSYAFLIDWHIRIILALAWLIGTAALFGLMEGRGIWDDLFDSVGSLVFYVVVLPPALLYFLYHPVLEIALKGRTPGKRAAGGARRAPAELLVPAGGRGSRFPGAKNRAGRFYGTVETGPLVAGFLVSNAR